MLIASRKKGATEINKTHLGASSSEAIQGGIARATSQTSFRIFAPELAEYNAYGNRPNAEMKRSLSWFKIKGKVSLRFPLDYLVMHLLGLKN